MTKGYQDPPDRLATRRVRPEHSRRQQGRGCDQGPEERVQRRVLLSYSDRDGDRDLLPTPVLRPLSATSFSTLYTSFAHTLIRLGQFDAGQRFDGNTQTVDRQIQCFFALSLQCLVFLIREL